MRGGVAVSTAGSRLKSHPSDTFKPQLRPGMSIVCSDFPNTVCLTFARSEADLDARRDTSQPGHQGHGGRELFAVAALVLRGSFQVADLRYGPDRFGAVPELGPEPVLDG